MVKAQKSVAKVVKKSIPGAESIPSSSVLSATQTDWKWALALKGNTRKDALLHIIVEHYEFKEKEEYAELHPLDKPLDMILGNEIKKNFGENKCSFCQEIEETDFIGQNLDCCDRTACDSCFTFNRWNSFDKCILCSLVCQYCHMAWKQKGLFTCDKQTCIEAENDDEDKFIVGEDTTNQFLETIKPYLI